MRRVIPLDTPDGIADLRPLPYPMACEVGDESLTGGNAVVFMSQAHELAAICLQCAARIAAALVTYKKENPDNEDHYLDAELLSANLAL